MSYAANEPTLPDLTHGYALLQGDCLEVMRTLPDACVQTCVTSPPYYGLRCYDGGCAEIGLESTPEAYVAKLVDVFREVRRVLRDDGTLWLNLGDSYSGSNGNGTVAQSNSGLTTDKFTKYQNVTGRIAGLKPKDLIGIPWMVAFALRAGGWWLRQDIIWAKTAPMPESVTDRCTKAHEYVFLLTKNANYYYDAEAIREENADPDRTQFARGQKIDISRKDADANSRFAQMTANGRNKRSVWTLGPESFSGAHFATMPTKLVEPCILAGSKLGDLVLDPFSGAATTGLVALKHHRQYIGCELNPSYIEMAHKRLLPVASQPLLLGLETIAQREVSPSRESLFTFNSSLE